jgi:hypothetical protein
MVIDVIRTPGEFERTLEAPLYRVNRWSLPLSPDRDEQVGAAIQSVFGGRDRAAAADEIGVVTSYLSSIAAPLDELYALGFQVVAVLTHGRYAVPTTRGRTGFAVRPVDMADYLVAPDPCYFRPCEAEFADPVHKLGAGCVQGHATIVTTGPRTVEKVFNIWVSRHILERDFERAVPWCATCERADDTPSP